jgi:hypothetical protein
MDHADPINRPGWATAQEAIDGQRTKPRQPGTEETEIEKAGGWPDPLSIVA